MLRAINKTLGFMVLIATCRSKRGDKMPIRRSKIPDNNLVTQKALSREN
jgi:hypothetical protein